MVSCPFLMDLNEEKQLKHHLQEEGKVPTSGPDIDSNEDVWVFESTDPREDAGG